MIRWLIVIRLAALPAMLVLTACSHPSPGLLAPERASEAEAAARRAVANEQSIDPSSIPGRTLGVAPFAVHAADTALAPLAYGLADLLMTDLARSRQLELVDRLHLDALLRELRLAESGRVDTATAPRVGKLAGARRLIVGSLVQRPGGELGIEARIADVPTGEVRQAVSARAPLDAILDAEKELVFRLFRELGVTLTPAEQAAVEQRPTKNLAALLAYSRGVRLEVHGDQGAAAREYQAAVRLDPGFAQAGARLSVVQPSAAPSVASAQVARAAGAAANRVNGVFTSPIGGSQIGGPTDPVFPAGLILLTITITMAP
jgi:TolB-like protein